MSTPKGEPWYEQYVEALIESRQRANFVEWLFKECDHHIGSLALDVQVLRRTAELLRGRQDAAGLSGAALLDGVATMIERDMYRFAKKRKTLADQYERWVKPENKKFDYIHSITTEAKAYDRV
ncbi:hypothetical protein [Alicyclobacillus shizuokensis]|uniref:hypothetical protein n=1 Tax=Alicyclobacillus shizuokensis TaxID=392014 RepID=UPI000830304A|nr:hypothetical protein [Alicyclobacillus shizuokensis]